MDKQKKNGIQRSVKKKIFFVEDDHKLAGQIIEKIQKESKAIDIILFTNVKSISESIEKNISDIHLLILDIMLPDTKSDYDKIQELNKQIKEMNKQISNAKDYLKKMSLREKRQAISLEVYEKINMRGGLDVAKTYVELCKTLKKSQVPILFLTAVQNKYRMEEAKEICKKKYVCLCKPVAPDEIVQTINKLIKIG